MLTFSMQNSSCELNLQNIFERKQFFCAMECFNEYLKNNVHNEKMLCQGDG